MLVAGAYEEETAYRVLEYCSPHPAWQRQLWSVGTILGLRESLEAAEAQAASVLSEAASKDLWTTIADIAIADPGLGTMAERHTARNCLLKGLVSRVSEYSVLEQLIVVSSPRYLAHWARHMLQPPQQRKPPEQVARAVASHLLDAGFSQQFLFDWLNERIAVDPVQITLDNLLDQAGAMAEAPATTFLTLIAFEAAPIQHQQLPPTWRTATEVKNWLKQQGFPSVQQAGGLMLEIVARDVWAALEEANANIDAVKARFAIGTRREVRFREEAWIGGYPHPFRLEQNLRRAEVGSIERSGKLYAASGANLVDSSLELMAPLNTGLLPSAIASGWAAVEALLVRADDSQRGLAAADRLAALVACSVPRAELTTLAYKHANNSNDALSNAITQAPTNRDKARLVAAAIAGNQVLNLAEVPDKLALDRVKLMLAAPKVDLGRLQRDAAQSFHRLYRQRNFVMHWGKKDSLAAKATLRTSVGILGAGVDRIAHAWFTAGVTPLALAAKAHHHIQVADQPGAVALVDLLE